MKWRLTLLVLVVVVAVALAPTVALAGPGGKIASVVVKSFWGRVLLAGLVLLFLPIIIYVMAREALAQRRTLRDLQRLRQVNPAFDWLTLKDRATECFHRVHSAWRREDMAQASAWMTDWYWQNQQLAHLDRWAEQGLVNRCTVKNVGRMRPLHLICRNADGAMTGSRLVIAITANMEDYLEPRNGGPIVEGEKGYKDVETVWTFELSPAGWRVANIEEDEFTLAYAQMTNDVAEALPESVMRRV